MLDFRRHTFALSLICLLALSACGSHGKTKWQFTLRADGADTVIDMDGVTLVFENMDIRSEGGMLGGGGGSLAVAGSGFHQNTVVVNKRPFRNVYEDGQNTMTFEGHTLILTDGGTQLHYGDEVVDLSGEKPRVVITSDGTLRKS